MPAQFCWSASQHAELEIAIRDKEIRLVLRPSHDTTPQPLKPDLAEIVLTLMQFLGHMNTVQVKDFSHVQEPSVSVYFFT